MSNLTMLDVFRQEVESQITILSQGLQSLENQPQTSQVMESLARAAYMIQGSARLVEIEPIVQIAHQIQECLNKASKQKFTLNRPHLQVLLEGTEAILRITQQKEENLTNWLSENQQHIQIITNTIANLLTADSASLASPRGEWKNGDVKESAPTILVTQEAREAASGSRGERNDHSPVPPAPLSPAASSPATIAPTVAAPEPPQHHETTIAQDPQPSSGGQEMSGMEDTSMLELFQLEVEAQATVLNDGLLSLESDPGSPKVLESLMRAAHSVKGAARIVALDAAVNLAHVMEDCFVAAQNQKITLEADGVDIMLHAVDLLSNISQQGQSWVAQNRSDIEFTREQLAALLTPGAAPVKREPVAAAAAPPQQTAQASGTLSPPVAPSPPPVAAKNPAGKGAIASPNAAKPDPSQAAGADAGDRVVRVSADNLNRIMGLAGESLIEANWLQPFADSLTLLKKRQLELSKILENFQQSLSINHYQDADTFLNAARAKERECREILGDRVIELELYARRTGSLSDRLYQEVIASNMRPFNDGVQGFPRMIRDLARKLNKQVKFEIAGKSTPVDRDILKKLEAPLTHILRNAVDHGLEMPEERIAAGKPPEGTMRLEAVHRGGMLSITIIDDGKGVDPERLRQKVIDKGLSTPEMASQLDDSELLEFLFLPGFSTAKQVTEISGRGVGLDIAKSMAQEVGGTIRASSQVGKGTSFHFQLPLTLSVVRTLLVEISGEPYAFPLARIEQIVIVNREEISSVENRQYFTMDNRNIGLISAYQILELQETHNSSDTLAVVVIGEQSDFYGLVVDKFLGEHDLVVRPLDARLGKVQDISAAALMGDGSPILIVDVSDLMRSVDNLLNNSHLNRIVSSNNNGDEAIADTRKSILVVDDSITVREMERKLLQNKGYKVDVAVDGMEGWHAVSSNHYDLVVSDVDMPRMNGIEFTNKIKNSPKLNKIPVIIVSYKDREEDRLRGLEAGADYYLTKSSFQDDTLVNAVYDLIGH